MVGSAIVRRLIGDRLPEECLVTRTRAELDLTDQAAVRAFFAAEHIDEVYLAAACIHVMQLPKSEYESHTEPRLSHINVGFGEDITVSELANCIARVVGFDGQIVFDTDRPDGTPRKLLDSARLNASGWQAQVGLEEGLRLAYADFQAAERA